MDDNDPWNWDVDRVLEASLREHEADGHTILTYPDETELCNELGIRILKHKATFRHALNKLRLRSQKYQNNQNEISADEPARKRRRLAPTVISDKDDINTNSQSAMLERIERQEPEDGTVAQLARACLDLEKRRIWPQLARMRYQLIELGQHISRYFRDAGLSNYDILRRDDTDSAAQHDVCEFTFDRRAGGVFRSGLWLCVEAFLDLDDSHYVTCGDGVRHRYFGCYQVVLANICLR
ncbi:hypothetical protein F5B19DRAFT_498687 [Rostrohypoxylon terebratum]|nr:hypothetical protein F5B19DRAFT_498687 [Rostrohypoxylon terebratum]